jgi:hypothetical protein
MRKISERWRLCRGNIVVDDQVVDTVEGKGKVQEGSLYMVGG